MGVDMEVSITYTIQLSEEDAQLLKKFLGSLNNPEFAERGIRGEARERLHALWSMLPDEPEEE